MNDDIASGDTLRDFAAILTALIFTLVPGLSLCLAVFYSVGPLIWRPLDPVGLHGAIGMPLAFIVLFYVGALIGGTLWLVIMSRFLPKHTMHRWLIYGPQIKPLLKLNLRLLDFLYRKRRHGTF
jgi:hypothetical protein